MEPFDFAAIRQALHDWLHAQTGLPVIWGFQSAPPPRCPFATLTLVSGPTAIAPLDEAQGIEAQDSIILMHRGPRTLTIGCQAYAKPHAVGKTATNCLLRAQASLRLPSVRAELGAVGLTVLEDLGIQEIPDRIGPSWRSRASMDVRFAVTSQISEPVDVIESVTVTEGEPH